MTFAYLQCDAATALIALLCCLIMEREKIQLGFIQMYNLIASAPNHLYFVLKKDKNVSQMDVALWYEGRHN